MLRKAASNTAYKERIQKTKVTGLAISTNMLVPGGQIQSIAFSASGVR